MALVFADRVKETTTTTGTGTLSLAGAATGFQSFAAIGNGNTCYYAVSSVTGSEWEVGLGTYSSTGPTLARTSIFASSNSGSAVSFSAGTKDVYVVYPADKVATIDDIPTNNNELTNGAGYITGNQTITLSGDATGSGTTSIAVTVANDSHTHDTRYYTETEVSNFFSGTTAKTGYNKTNWDTAYGWGNHASAGYLTGNQTITLSGDVSGSGTTSISVTVADDSHNHIISNVDGLQTALDAKLASSSYTASDVLTKIKTVDGSGSGLDADTVDGIQASSFLRSDASDSASGTITLTNSADLRFQDTGGTYPTSSGGFQWVLNNDSARIYAQQPASDYIDFFFKITDNAGSTDRFVFWIDDYRGATYDKYPAYFHGSAAYLAVPVDGSGNPNTSSARLAVPYSGNVTIDGNKILTTADEGSGNGLDADTLDGQQGTYYQAAATALTTSTSFGGDVSGTYNAIVVADDSHNHVISNVDGLQTALDGKYSTSGGTISGNVTIDNGTSTQLNIVCDDTGTAGLRAYGNAQGTGYVEVGQSTTYGGGISYNGDGSPAFAGGEASDYISFYRLSNGTRTVVFDYNYNNSVVRFKDSITVAGDLTVSGGDIVLDGTGRIQGIDTVSAGTDAANKTYVDNAVAGAIGTSFPFYDEDGNSDPIAITNGSFPFYKADGTQDNIGVS